MNDDEEGQGSGIGALAAFQLGRWSAEDDAQLDRVMTSLRPRRSGGSTRADFVRANEALAAANTDLLAENARLRQQLLDYQHNYRRLCAWRDEVEPFLDTLRKPGE